MLDRIQDFFAMGGHGFYIWSAYGVFLVCLVGEMLSFRGRRAKAIRAIEREAKAKKLREAR